MFFDDDSEGSVFCEMVGKVSDAKSEWRDEHVEVLQHVLLPTIQLGPLRHVSLKKSVKHMTSEQIEFLLKKSLPPLS